MYIPVKSEANKIAALKAVGVVALIPAFIVFVVVGLVIDADIVIWGMVGVLILMLSVLFGIMIAIAIHDGYVHLYAKFSNTPRRQMWG